MSLHRAIATTTALGLALTALVLLFTGPTPWLALPTITGAGYCWWWAGRMYRIDHRSNT